MDGLQLWIDKKDHKLDPRLFSDTAERYAKELGRQGRNQNKNSQLRRFFDELSRLNDRAQSGQDDWGHILPYAHMLIAKANYAQGRKLVTSDFVHLIQDGIKQIEDKEDLKIFTRFFESFMGFYKVHGPN